MELSYRAALTGDLPRMEQAVERIRRLNRDALQVARALARREPILRMIAPSTRDRALKLLTRVGIAEHVARGDWRLVNPLFASYLRDLTPIA